VAIIVSLCVNSCSSERHEWQSEAYHQRSWLGWTSDQHGVV
jgi:hypothetical protein